LGESGGDRLLSRVAALDLDGCARGGMRSMRTCWLSPGALGKSPLNSPPLSVYQTRSRRVMPQWSSSCWMRAAKTALSAVLRFSAKAQNDSPLRGAERAQLLTQSQDPLRRSLHRVTARRAAMLLRTRVAVLLIAPPPPADRERAGGDQPGSDLPPPLLA